MTLTRIEMRRALHRRAVRVLVAIALLGCALAGVVTFVGSHGKSLAELRLDDEGSPALVSDWWIASTNEGFLSVAMFFLILGGFLGGATVAGAEWRAGTVTTLLTWEPRRYRVLAARCASSAVLAFAISFGLQILFLASFLPAVAAHGSTAGSGGWFWFHLAVAMVRTSAITAAAAVLAVSLATLARNTAFAVIAVFVWMTLVEGLIRGLRPSAGPWLWGENVATVMTWGQLPDSDFERGPLLALATLVVYCATVMAASAVAFRHRDIAAAA